MRGVGRGALALLCVVGVPVLVLGLVRVFFGVPISAYRPLINDEVAYWHQALTFSHVGFNGGFYTVDEMTNTLRADAVRPARARLRRALRIVWLGLRLVPPHGSDPESGRARLRGMGVGHARPVERSASGPVRLAARHLLARAVLGADWDAGKPPPPGAIVMACLLRLRAWASAAAIDIRARLDRRWRAVIHQTVVADSRAAVGIRDHASRALASQDSGYRRVAAVWSRDSDRLRQHHCAVWNGFFFLRAASLSLGVQAIVSNVSSNLERLAMSDQFHPIELLERYQYWLRS